MHNKEKEDKAEFTLKAAGATNLDQRHLSKGLPKAKLTNTLEYIKNHLEENICLADIAEHLEMSQYHFSRLFKQSMGMTAHTYLVQQRIEKAQHLLRHTNLSVLVIAEQCGFANPSHFAKAFRKSLGQTPIEFRLSE